MKWTPALIGRELATFDAMVAKHEQFLRKIAPEWLDAADKLRVEYAKCGDQFSNCVLLDRELGEAAVAFQNAANATAPKLKIMMSTLQVLGEMIGDGHEKC